MYDQHLPYIYSTVHILLVTSEPGYNIQTINVMEHTHKCVPPYISPLKSVGGAPIIIEMLIQTLTMYKSEAISQIRLKKQYFR